jgi:hypothetical protein
MRLALSFGNEDTIVASLALISTIASAVGTVVSVIGSIQQGQAQQEMANYRAKLAEMRGKEEFAAGQRRMMQERRRKELALSSLQARAAASGGDTTDPTVVNLGAGLEQEGEFRALTEFYKGENAKRGYQDAAAAARFEGEQAASASLWKAGGTLLSGVGSFASNYDKAFGSGNYYATGDSAKIDWYR